MKHYLIGILLLAVFPFAGISQEELSYFLPSDVTYNKNIPTPEDFFGQKVGEWHLNFEQVLSYVREVDRLSNRAIVQEYARSYENRPLVQMIFTSEKNQKNLDELKKLHQSLAVPGSGISTENVPLVVNLGYSIHGNESSGTNASVLTVYYLAAAEGEKIDKLLSNTIILVDPCLNPDGLTRHSTWANMHQSFAPMGDSNSSQFNEMWPGGRSNHYWFDLNRDYLLQVNPESRGRVAKFYEWRPNIITDHHEMGADATFFFQPGVPTRNNPLTPEINYQLTHEIAQYHAKFLDKIGATYFSEEEFDDYYIGKGSSYPDINGSVGILFEQAGFRGRIRETINGPRKLAYGIRNHFTVTLSSLEAAMNLKNELLDFQKNFYPEALKLAEKDPVKAYIFGDENDRVKTQIFIDLLNRHQIQVYKNEKTIEKNGVTFSAGKSYLVPTNQNQYRMVKSIFDVVTTFTDSTFYDVSTWSFPQTFYIPSAEISSLKEIGFSSEKILAEKITGKVIGGKSGLAYLFRWNEFSTPDALYQLQNAGLRTKVATDKFSFIVEGKTEPFTYGTILVEAAEQPLNKDQLYELVSKIAANTGVDFYALTTGLSPTGIDLGSNNFMVVTKPEILMLIGGSTNSRDAGEIWHMFDQRYHIPVCMSETESFSRINLNDYNSLILPGGSYNELSAGDAQKMKSWIQNGGTLILYKNAATWASKNEIGKTKFAKEEKDSTQLFSYADRSKEENMNFVSGAIFETELDVTHPLCFGYTSNKLPVFKTGISVAESLKEKYAEPVNFTAKPYISGFISDKNLEKLKNAPVVSVQKMGRGKIITYHENMTFRGIWLGTNKLFTNAVFFGNVIE